MTAEICVMNKQAVALASDSAATLTKQKIYNSANKLFTLSKYQPVGIMIYGNSTLMGIPWETIVKMFRSEIGGKQHPKLEEYSNEFMDFIRTFPYSDKVVDEYIAGTINNYFNELLSKIYERVQGQIEKGEITPNSFDEALELSVSRTIEAAYKLWNKDKYVTDYNNDFQNKFYSRYEILVNTIIDNVFSKFDINDNMREKLKKVALFIFTKERFSNNCTGVVIAGFGGEDIFPSVLSYTIENAIFRMLKFKKDEENSKIENRDGCIISYAQKEMVYSFMRGIDPSLKQFSESYLRRIFKSYPETVLTDVLKENNIEDELISKILDKLKDDGVSLFQDYLDNVNEYSTENYSNNILQIVDHLPKDELAIMAETLVNLTSFKRKVTKDAETVGGPIDVAVISKGDGFIWIKRKHYFESNLNHHFFNNYFKED